MVLRLAEQYLIRAEANLKLGDLAGAASDINTIRSRAGLGNTPASTETDLLHAIAQERRIELFTEWGHRWLDLRRYGIVDAVLGPLKGASWNTTDQLYPIPLTQIQNDPAMSHAQNPGY
jgi:starch-binding outer membrane protein, SusD/RagB family